MFEYFHLIVFHLVERIAIAEKSMKSVLGRCIDMLGFSYNALPTRHEVPRKPYLQEDKLQKAVKPMLIIKNYNCDNETTKLSNIADMAKTFGNI